MTIERDGIKITLTDKEIESAYRVKETEYRTQDFVNYINEYIEWCIVKKEPTDEEIEEIASSLAHDFICFREDCNVPEAEVMRYMVKEFFEREESKND